MGMPLFDLGHLSMVKCRSGQAWPITSRHYHSRRRYHAFCVLKSHTWTRHATVRDIPCDIRCYLAPYNVTAGCRAASQASDWFGVGDCSAFPAARHDTAPLLSTLAIASVAVQRNDHVHSARKVTIIGEWAFGHASARRLCTLLLYWFHDSSPAPKRNWSTKNEQLNIHQ